MPWSSAPSFLLRGLAGPLHHWTAKEHVEENLFSYLCLNSEEKERGRINKTDRQRYLVQAAFGEGLEHLVGFFRFVTTNNPHGLHRQGLAAHQHHHIYGFLEEGNLRVLVLEVKTKISDEVLQAAHTGSHSSRSQESVTPSRVSWMLQKQRVQDVKNITEPQILNTSNVPEHLSLIPILHTGLS